MEIKAEKIFAVGSALAAAVIAYGAGVKLHGEVKKLATDYARKKMNSSLENVAMESFEN
ncbi:MAG: hypothetical protein Q4B64_02695 [Spirochaetales bacterium]|nr:hypothetical protein [Spirochaetales bacterium]